MRETLWERMPLPFEIDDRMDLGLITAHVGVSLVIELFRRVGAAQGGNAQSGSNNGSEGRRPRSWWRR